MRILALDLATTAGFAHGEAGTVPRSGVVKLKGKGGRPEDAAGGIACFLRDQFTLERPDLVVVEDFLHPSVQRSGAAAIMAIEICGAVAGVCACYGVRLEKVAASTWRVHFCGQKSAIKAPRGPKTAKQRADMRAATKLMTIKRAQVLGYMSRDETDDNQADACGLFDYASAHFARKPLASFALFGGVKP